MGLSEKPIRGRMQQRFVYAKEADCTYSHINSAEVREPTPANSSPWKTIAKALILLNLNIPQNYRRFPGELPTLPALPDWVSVKFCEVDYGPASKVLPTVERWRHKEADFLICDDDCVHDFAWIERLAKTRQERPDDIITGSVGGI